MRAWLMVAVTIMVSARSRAQPVCPDGMVRVPGGTFAMGSPDGIGDDDEHPRHVVTVSAFCIDRTEVTVKAYEACAAAKHCTASHREISPYCNHPDRGDHPVNCVDWNQAVAYCRWLGKRLPIEAEWEYAARGGDGRLYPWGNEPPSATRLNACGRECVAFGKRVLGREWPAMYDADDGWVTTAPVGSFPAGASPFGALDMAGNVWEWTADWRGDYPASPVTNPRGPATGSGRINRGNGWHAHLAVDVRTAVRSSDDPAVPTNSTGLRCALSRWMIDRRGTWRCRCGAAPEREPCVHDRRAAPGSAPQGQASRAARPSDRPRRPAPVALRVAGHDVLYRDAVSAGVPHAGVRGRARLVEPRTPHRLQGDLDRPVAVTQTQQGALVVSDDAGNCLWRIRYSRPAR